jgi:magnesium transporter
MNFKFMPELSWRFGYPAVMALMAVMAAGMLIYFKRKDWF